MNRTEKLLLVEDEPEIRMATQMRLTAMGYQVEACGDGLACLESVRNEVPDLVLMDLRMPRMDGISAIRQLSEDPALAKIPVIVLSASPGDLNLALDSGARFFLTKPYQQRQLISAIESSLGRCSLSGSPMDRNGQAVAS